jgi:hypothetical protein
MSQLPNWVDLYEDFLAESDPAELKSRIESLETAMFERLQELKGTSDGQEERIAIQGGRGKAARNQND